MGEVSINLRHFTKHETKDALALQAILWFEDGSSAGPIDLNAPIRVYKGEQEKKRRKVTDKPFRKNEIYGVAQLGRNQTGRIAFIQLRKQTSFWTRTLGSEEDIFIQDAWVTQSGRFRAYFRFTGFLINLNNLLLPNVISPTGKGKSLAVAEVRRLQAEEKLVIQDRLWPTLEWACENKTRSLGYKIRTILDGAGFGYGRTFLRFIIDFVAKRNYPLVANLVFSVALDVARYAGTPGFARIISGDFSFGLAKFSEFVKRGQKPVDAARARLKELGAQEKWRMSVVNFEWFLEGDRLCTSDRELDDVKRISAHYKRDEEFGRQITEGLLCTHVRVVPKKGGPKWLQELVKSAGPNKSNRLFYLDFSSLVGVPRNHEVKAHFTPARCLLAHDGKVLRPIAISLHYCDEYFGNPEEPREDESEADRLKRRLTTGEWRTHLPSHGTWEIAKIFCKCAAAQDHEIVAHALRTHLVIEPFVVALERQVPLNHFLYRLLKTHFRYTLDVNFKARTNLINRGGLFDQFVSTGGIHSGHLQFMARTFESWTIDEMMLPRELASRGFEQDPNDEESAELPEYRYAQDAMTLWNALSEYVQGVVMKTYPTERTFGTDATLRNYFMDVQTNGFPTSPPMIPTTREELINLLTGIIFTATVQHAAVNFPQFAHYGLVANAPLSLNLPAPFPAKKAEKPIEAYYPREDLAEKMISTVYQLSRFVPDDERFLLSFPGKKAPCDNMDREPHFFNQSLSNDPKYAEVCATLESALMEIEKGILRREPSAYGTRYRWLLPSLIPTSIAT